MQSNSPFVEATISLDTSLSRRNVLRVSLIIHNDVGIPPKESESAEELNSAPSCGPKQLDGGQPRVSAASQMDDIRQMLSQIAFGGAQGGGLERAKASLGALKLLTRKWIGTSRALQARVF